MNKYKYPSFENILPNMENVTELQEPAETLKYPDKTKTFTDIPNSHKLRARQELQNMLLGIFDWASKKCMKFNKYKFSTR